MTSYSFGKRSLDNLGTVHPDLQRLTHLALSYSPHDFTITEGIRSIERQRELVRIGASKTMNSYHLRGHAIDFYPYYSGSVQVHAPKDMFKGIADAFKKAANELGLQITWDGDWSGGWDMPHIQIELK